MDIRVLEARHYTSAYCRALERIVKDYEIDIERTNGRQYCHNGVEYTLSRGDVLIRKPHDTVWSLGEQDTYIVTVDLLGEKREEVYSRNIPGVFHPACECVLLTQLPPVVHPRNAELLLELYRELIALPNHRSVSASALAWELLCTLNAEVAHGRYLQSKPRESMVQHVIRYMTQNFQHRITLTALAEMVHLEKSYFIRLFRKETGKTPMKMLSEIRLDHGSDLLVNTELKINEIAAVCGYNSSSFFIAEYKKRFGQSPEAQRHMRI